MSAQITVRSSMNRDATSSRFIGSIDSVGNLGRLPTGASRSSHSVPARRSLPPRSD